MPKRIKLVSIVGARPQFVKLAPIARAIDAMADVEHCIVHTGQHYDDRLSASFFEQLEIPRPNANLEVGSGSHAEQTAKMMTLLERYLEETGPSGILVYGDTNSTLAATLTAAKSHIPTAHIEAGLRSFDRAMPEEVNRIVADHCSDRLYAPTPQAMENLKTENLAERAVLSGDVMLDAILSNVKLAQQKSTALDELGLADADFALATVHRASNTTKDAIVPILKALESAAELVSSLVFPVHPRTRVLLTEIDFKPSPMIRLVEPLSYLDSIRLIQSAKIVITDSGGVQKEAAFLNTPCLTVRDETEWTETVSLGVNRLVGSRAEHLAELAEQAMANTEMFDKATKQGIAEHYGSGEAASLIVTDFAEWLA